MRFVVSNHPWSALPVSRRMAGLTLIEVLVAVLVLSVGLLGMGGLQMTSLQFSHSAHLRSQASFLIYDIIDRMRSNRTAAEGGQYAAALGEGFPVPAMDCANVANSCTPSQMAAFDKWEWKEDLKERLPGGDGAVEPVPGAVEPGQFVITVRWFDKRGEDAADRQADISIWTEL